VQLTFAIVVVSNMRAAVSFYGDVVGLTLRFESPDWAEFESGGATLALHASDGSPSASDDPAQMPAGRCRPGFSVPDLDAFHQRMIGKGVACAQVPSAVFGVRVAQYVDPDGLIISVSEER